MVSWWEIITNWIQTTLKEKNPTHCIFPFSQELKKWSKVYAHSEPQSSKLTLSIPAREQKEQGAEQESPTVPWREDTLQLCTYEQLNVQSTGRNIRFAVLLIRN